MFRISTWLLIALPLSVFGGNLNTVFPYTVEVVKSPVQKVETIIEPSYTKSFSPGAAAVAVAGTTSLLSSAPVVQRIESYSSGDSSNAEIRDLLRSLLTELQSSKSVTTLSAPLVKSSYRTTSDSYGPPEPLVKSTYQPPSDSYGPPAPLVKSSYRTTSDSYGPPPSDSYSAPPRNTFRDSGSASYPDTGFRSSKPEKVVLVEEKLPTAILSAPAAAAVAQVQTSAPLAVKEVVRTVYQPVYVPVQQYAAPQAELLTVSQPLTAVPTTVQTGASAVAYSQIHHAPAYAIQQQLTVPVQSANILDNGGYQK